MRKLSKANRDALRKTVRMLRKKNFTIEWVDELFNRSYCFLCKANRNDNDCQSCPLWYENRDYFDDCLDWKPVSCLFNYYCDLRYCDTTHQLRGHKTYPKFKEQCYKVADWLEKRFLKDGK